MRYVSCQKGRPVVPPVGHYNSVATTLKRFGATAPAAAAYHPAACSIHELQDQFAIDPSTAADTLPHIAASIAIMSVPGLIAWGADASMRLAYNLGPLKAASQNLSAFTSGDENDGGAVGGAGAGQQLAVAGAGAAGAPGAAATTSRSVALAAPLVPFLNLSYGYLPLVRAPLPPHLSWVM